MTSESAAATLDAMSCARLVRMTVSLCLLAGATGRGWAQGAGVGTDQDAGARQYAATCAACHGADGSGSLKGPAIARLPKTIALSDAELIGIVRDGVPGKGMPGAKALGDETIAAVVRYLRVLQGVSGVSG
jgi:mono/diheme cytochrome c family protein